MQGLRKRRTAEEAAPDEPSSSAVVETLKALDVYPKTLAAPHLPLSPRTHLLTSFACTSADGAR